MTSTISDIAYKYSSSNIFPITPKPTPKPYSYVSCRKIADDLLTEAVRAAKEQLQKNMNDPLWEPPLKAGPVRNEEPRLCIAEAYDAAQMKQEYPTAEEIKMPDMDSAVEKAIEKRKEARAELVLDFLDAHWGEPEFGETHTWDVIFDTTPDKTYRYAAIFCDDHRWYVTNQSGGRTNEALKALIADICIRAEVYFNGELVA